MSLINDALRRAKDAQPNASAPADGPSLRPDFSSRRSHAGGDFLLPALIVVILVLAALLLVEWFRGGNEIKVRARTIPDSQIGLTAPTSEPAPAAVSQSSVAAAPGKNPATNIPIASTAPAPLSAPTSATNAPTLAVAPAAPAPPPPVTYRLQSLFYRARNPSAVINGKTLFIGDRVGEAHVVAIDKESATIVTAKGETKVLELAQ